MKRMLSVVLLLPMLLGTAQAIADTGQVSTGQSQMSVGFTPPEKKADGPRPWTRRDLDEVRRRHQRENERPRCEQDRLLTDTRPCADR